MRRPQPKHYKLNLTEAELKMAKLVMNHFQTLWPNLNVAEKTAATTLEHKVRNLG